MKIGYTNSTDENVWILRNPSHYQRMKQGKYIS